MSEVKLNLIDLQETLHGTIHGSVADAAVAALSAEPETIAELQTAMARYIKPLDDRRPFATFLSSDHSSAGSSPLDARPWDAGLVVIDLAARIVAVESTYSNPGPSGEVRYHDGTQATDIAVLYRVPDDWLFVNSVEAYLWSRERRSTVRLAKTRLDVREVLYGAPLLDFIVNECCTIEASEAATDHNGSGEDALVAKLSGIHSCWLMTPREDLGGSSPRDVMLSKQDFIDFDLHTRALQWSFQGEGPPCLAKDSHAYRFAGFGTHEWVIYYDLVRDLLWFALKNIRPPSVSRGGGVINQLQNRGEPDDLSAIHSTPARIDSEKARLEKFKTAWLEQPQRDYDGRIPAILIENERRRLPIALRPHDMIIDEDCPVCQMFGDETTPLGMGVGFWHLDGSHMDEDFAFSHYKTHEEWEAENRRREEFSKEFNRRWEERQQRIARGEPLEPDPFFDPDPFADFEFADSSLVSGEAIDDDASELPQ